VRATLWTLQGARIGSLERRLPSGSYRFHLRGDFKGTVSASGAPCTGIHFLRVELRGEDRTKIQALKVIFRD
jgi:hypothetical protein